MPKFYVIFSFFFFLIFSLSAHASKEKIVLAIDNTEQSTKDNLVSALIEFRKKNINNLQAIFTSEKNPLAKEIINYWALMADIKNVDSSKIETAINENKSKVLSENLRRQLVNIAGEKNNYSTVIKYYPEINNPFIENKCFYAVAKFNSGSRSELDNLINDSWKNNFSPGIGCRLAHLLISENNFVDTKDIKWRTRQAVYQNLASEFYSINKSNLSQSFAKTLFAKSPELSSQINKVLEVEKPLENSQIQDILIYSAIANTRSNPLSGAAFLQSYANYINKNSQAVICSYLTHAFSKNYDDKALQYLRCSVSDLNRVLLDSQIETVIRFFIRKNKWSEVIQTIATLSNTQQQDIAWIYWRARALLNISSTKLNGDEIKAYLDENSQTDKDSQTVKNPQIKTAVTLLNQIAKRPDFYGALANEFFGNSPDIPEFTIDSTEDEIKNISSKPCFVWASTLISFGGELRSLGNLEWIDCVSNELTTDREKLAAARFALSQNIFDRAINTAILTKQEHDWRIRFITPFYQELTQGANEQDLPIELIYGLIRQESRFIIDARSVTGAMGLMQIMPKTGAWLAKKLAFKPYQQSMLADTPTNVLFGTSYIRMILDKTDHPVLMCASYNAGPSRANRWMYGEDNIDAVAYVESIPFSETRGYVKNVLWNATIYQKIMGKSSAKISSWLTPITRDLLISNEDLP